MKMKKLFFILLFLFPLFSFSAWAQTTYYNVTAEEAYSPLCALTNATTQWTQCESKVTRSSNQAKNGSFAIRAEEITDGVQPGTCGEGNCTGHATHWTNPSSGLAAGATDLPQDLYFSTWFFFPSSATEGIGWPDNGNWQIWRNFFELKNDNDSNYQDGSPQLEGRCCKIAVSFQHLDTPTATRRWMIALKDPKWTASPTQAQQDFVMDYFDGAAPGMHNLDTACCGENRPSDWYSDAFTVPLDDWVFFEMHIKFATTNGVIEVWTGTASTGLIKIFEFQDVDLNTLKAIDEAGSNAWSTNKYLMWSVNNYISDSNPAGTYVLYHDDTRITDFQVGPTLPEFGGGEPGSTFPQVEASTTSSMGTAVTSHTVALPAGIVSGELLKVIFGVHDLVGVEEIFATSHIAGTASNPENAVGVGDGTWTTDTGNTSWTSRWAMGDPTGAVSGTQTIRVKARKNSNGGGTPTISIDLFENGVLVSNLVATTDVTITGDGQLLSGTFDASTITNRADVEVRVVTIGNGSGGGGRSVQVDSIEWVINPSVGTPVITLPSGWSVCTNQGSPTSADTLSKVRQIVLYRQADGTEGSTVTITTDVAKRSAHYSARISGASNPASRAPECVTTNGTTGNPDSPALTPGDGIQDYLFFVATTFGVVLTPACAPTIDTYPANYINGVQQNSGGGSDAEARIGVARRELNTGSENPGAYSLSCTDAPWIATSVSIPPDLPDPPPPPTSLGIGGVSGNF